MLGWEAIQKYLTWITQLIFISPPCILTFLSIFSLHSLPIPTSIPRPSSLWKGYKITSIHGEGRGIDWVGYYILFLMLLLPRIFALWHDCTQQYTDDNFGLLVKHLKTEWKSTNKYCSDNDCLFFLNEYLKPIRVYFLKDLLCLHIWGNGFKYMLKWKPRTSPCVGTEYFEEPVSGGC